MPAIARMARSCTRSAAEFIREHTRSHKKLHA